MSRMMPFACVLASAVALPLTTFAQQAPVASGDETRALDVNVWLGAGHDLRLGAGRGAMIAPSIALEPRNSQGQLGFGAAYSRHRGRAALHTGLRDIARVDSAGAGTWDLDHQGSLGLAIQMTRRNRLETSHLASYAAVNPFAAVSALAAGDSAGTVPAALDHPLPTRSALTYAADSAVTHVLSRRSSVALTQGFTYSDTKDRRPMIAYLAGARFEHRLAPNRTMRVGYRTGSATFGAAKRHLQTHDVDVGADYSRSLPFSRRTTIAAGTGSSLVSDGTQRSFRMLANVTLVHRVATSWETRIEFSRPVQIVEGIAAPLVTNSVTASVAGPIGRHHRLTAIAGQSDGSVGLDARGSRVKRSTAACQWQVAMTRRISWNTEAFYAWTRFGPDVPVQSGIPREIQRVGVRAFVSYSSQLFRD